MTKEYKQYLIASAKYEIHQLKESGEKFVIDKSKLDLSENRCCFYGQKFGNSKNIRSVNFKEEYNIVMGFCRIERRGAEGNTALEALLSKKWELDQKEECIQILSEFCTFKEDKEQKDIDKLLNF